MKYANFFKLLEKKDHLINKLTSLTPEQKQEVIAFFTKHPKHENEIDWNRKDLEWEDFEEILNKDRVSASQLKNFVKEGIHYLVLHKSKNLVVYQPLTWMGSRYLASKDVAPYVEGKWCVAYQKNVLHWNRYSFDEEESFLYLCTPTTKWALEVDPSYYYDAWDHNDVRTSLPDFFNAIEKEVPNIKSILAELLPQAVENHSLIVANKERDERDAAILEKLRKEARDLQFKLFNKSFAKQLKKKGYYQWSGSLDLEDLKKLDLYDEKTGFFSEKVSTFKVLGDVDFSYCQVENIHLPFFIEGSLKVAFSPKINSIIIPNGVSSIDYSAFYRCSSLEEIVIPDSVTCIGRYAFAGCASLKKITLPNKLATIGSGAFLNCYSLKEIDIPDSVTNIDVSAFKGCSSLSRITLSNNMRIIPSDMLSGCSSLTEVTIPDSVIEIRDEVFYGCKSLKVVTLGENVKYFFYEAFKGCGRNLKKICINQEKDSIKRSKLEAAGIAKNAKIYWKGEF